MNYNRFLENAHRSDVAGRNIYTMGRAQIPDDHRAAATHPEECWDPPAPGLPGVAAIGHQIDVGDLLTLSFRVDGKAQTLSPVRNRWTPAWMETYYRSAPDPQIYPRSGTFCVRETKAFLPGDIFLGEVTMFNDRRGPVRAEAALKLPFEKQGAHTYRVRARILPGSLGREYRLEGFGAALTDGEADRVDVVIPGSGSVTFRYAFAFSPGDDAAALAQARSAFAVQEPFRLCEDTFNRWMDENAPELITENPDILKIYYYRYYVIYRGIHTPGTVLPGHDFSGECVYESPFGAWFGAPVGLSVPLQVEEMKWMKQLHAVRSQLANWRNQVGNTRGYIQATPMAVWNLYALRGDETLLEELYEACKGYALWKCDPSDPGKLPVQTGSWGTGAEYQPSFYQFTEPKYDWRHDNELSWQGFPHTKLHRVDECVFHGANLTACAKMAQRLGKREDQHLLETYAKQTLERIRTLCWNGEKGFFFDCDPETLRQCDESCCYDGFFPLLWGLFDGAYSGVFDRLKPGGSFTADFPVASVDQGSPMYWFDNCIAGPTASSEQEPHYYGCCWNGPTWPFATSFILEALGSAASEDPKLRELWLWLFDRYTQLHFAFGDRSLPRITEHYRATDGVSFSPYHEYFHSTWITLFMTYWAGIQVQEDRVVFHPMTREEFALENVRVLSRRFRFSQRRENGALRQTMEEITER